jgi:hypothetical protein
MILYCKLFLKTIYRNFCYWHIHMKRDQLFHIEYSIFAKNQWTTVYAIPLKEGRKASLRQIQLFPPSLVGYTER